LFRWVLPIMACFKKIIRLFLMYLAFWGLLTHLSKTRKIGGNFLKITFSLTVLIVTSTSIKTNSFLNLNFNTVCFDIETKHFVLFLPRCNPKQNSVLFRPSESKKNLLYFLQKCETLTFRTEKHCFLVWKIL
jgi:hypothetical protein